MKAKDVKAFSKKDILDIAKSTLKERKICDHCLGRQFAHVSTGFTNDERGRILRKNLKAEPSKGACRICGDIFRRLDKYADSAASRLKKLDFKTFLVGTVLSTELVKREEGLWEDIGIEHCESIKSELNRELGKLVFDRIKKQHDPKTPDVTVILNLEKDRIDLQVASLYIRGEYKKLVRGLPQTKWDKYDETVEDIIAAPFMVKTGGDGHSLHGSGREDIDALCLDGRPFVLEIKNPIKRKINLKKLASDINKSKKVQVLKLRITDRREVAKVKEMNLDKTYRARVQFRDPVRDIEILKKLKGTVTQRTPRRVEHRRADKIRKRKVLAVSWKKINNKNFDLQIKGEAGLYIKELVSGDGGRSEPSVSGLLKNPAVVKELDVIKIWKR